MKKVEVFTLISYAVLKWMFISSTAIWVTGLGTVQLLLDLEAIFLDQNGNELEFELSRM